MTQTVHTISMSFRFQCQVERVAAANVVANVGYYRDFGMSVSNAECRGSNQRFYLTQFIQLRQSHVHRCPDLATFRRPKLQYELARHDLRAPACHGHC